MEAFKIVRNVGGRLYSMISHWNSVEYVPGRPTKPEIGKLFVYVNPADILDRNPMPWEEIWSCEAKNPRRARRQVLGLGYLCPEHLKNYWLRIPVKEDWLTSFPYGTFLADEVTLDRKLYEATNYGWSRVSEIER